MGACGCYPEGLSLFGIARRMVSRVWDPSFESGYLFVRESENGVSLFFSGRISSEDFGILRCCDSGSSVQYVADSDSFLVSENSFGAVCGRLSSFIRRTEGVRGVQSLARNISMIYDFSLDDADKKCVSDMLHALHFRSLDFLRVDVGENVSDVVRMADSLGCNGRGIEIRGLESLMQNIKVRRGVSGNVLFPAFTPLEYYQTGDIEGCKFLEELDLHAKKYS